MMKCLIAEDNLTSRLLLQNLLSRYGKCHLASNGAEAVQAVREALEAGAPFDLICLDIMMPEMDGHAALKQIRALEQARGTSSSARTTIVMTTALEDERNVSSAYGELCDGYLVKPIQRADLEIFIQAAQLA